MIFVSPDVWGHKTRDNYLSTWLVSRGMLQCGLHDDIVKSQFRVKMAAFCQASEVHDFNVLKIFSEADNIPKAISGKYEYNFTVRKTLEGKILGK